MDKEEEKARRAKIHLKKLKALMLEAGRDLIDDEIVESMKEKVQELFKADGLPFTTPNLKAFQTGLGFGMGAEEALGRQEVITLMIALERIIDEKRDPVKEKALDDAMRKLYGDE